MKTICSINGTIEPLEKAQISITSVEAEYGFGVYETIKVRNGIMYFVDKHIERLFHSASCINLEHSLSQELLQKYLSHLLEELGEESCNIKILLYGGKSVNEYTLFILPSVPYYPNRKWYKEGASVISFTYERFMPQAKTLNMLASYYYYSEAKKQNCYDALLLDHNGNIVEGTRTNVFAIKGTTIFSPPENKILTGVTLLSLKKILEKHSEYNLTHTNISYKSLSEYDGMFLTSTSSKVLPINKVDEFEFKTIAPTILKLIQIYEDSVESSKGDFSLL